MIPKKLQRKGKQTIDDIETNLLKQEKAAENLYYIAREEEDLDVECKNLAQVAANTRQYLTKYFLFQI